MIVLAVYDYRYMGSVGLVFGVIWLTVGISLFYGIFKVWFMDVAKMIKLRSLNVLGREKVRLSLRCDVHD